MNIIVTGASRGVGHALVREFAKDPAHHIVAIARDIRALNDLQGACLNDQEDAHVYPVGYDLTEAAFPGRLLNDIEATIGKADILINNAGLLIQKPFSDVSPEDIDRLLDVNFKSVVLLIQALLPYMNPGSHIVNIGSMGVFRVVSNLPEWLFTVRARERWPSLPSAWQRNSGTRAFRSTCWRWALWIHRCCRKHFLAIRHLYRRLKWPPS